MVLVVGLVVFVPAVDEVAEVDVLGASDVTVKGTTVVDPELAVVGGAGAITPVSGRSLTSDPAAFTAT